MKNILIGAALVSSLTILSGCASGFEKKMPAAEKTFLSGKYYEAAKMLEGEVNATGKDQLLAMMECGMMLHTAAKNEASSKVFMAANELAKQMPVSVSQQAGSLFTNETVTNYRGEEFERILLHMYPGIDFLLTDKPEQAGVEFKAMSNLQQDIREKEGLKSFKTNLMAKYLASVAYELQGDLNNDANDYDFAYVELKQAYEANPSIDVIKRDLIRLSKKLGDTDDYNKWIGKFGRIETTPGDYADVVLIYQSGLGAIKASRGKLLDDKDLSMSIRVSLGSMPLQEGVTIAGAMIALAIAENPIPKFVKRSNKVNAIELSIDDKLRAKTTILENISETAVNTMEEKRSYVLGKTAAGIAVKVAASLATAYMVKKAAQRAKSGVAGLLGAVAGAAVGAGFASQIKPDLRCWVTLPDNLQVCKLRVPKGKHSIKLKLLANDGFEKDVDLGEVDIKDTKKKLIINYRTVY
jgi:uncharacterized protein